MTSLLFVSSFLSLLALSLLLLLDLLDLHALVLGEKDAIHAFVLRWPSLRSCLQSFLLPFLVLLPPLADFVLLGPVLHFLVRLILLPLSLFSVPLRLQKLAFPLCHSLPQVSSLLPFLAHLLLVSHLLLDAISHGSDREGLQNKVHFSSGLLAALKKEVADFVLLHLNRGLSYTTDCSIVFLHESVQ